MEDVQSANDQRSVEISELPDSTIPAELVRGIYANQISQVSNGMESVIDFSLIVPSRVARKAGTLDLEVDLDHTVVARIIVPRAIFAEFLQSTFPGFADEVEPDQLRQDKREEGGSHDDV